MWKQPYRKRSKTFQQSKFYGDHWWIAIGYLRFHVHRSIHGDISWFWRWPGLLGLGCLQNLLAFDLYFQWPKIVRHYHFSSTKLRLSHLHQQKFLKIKKLIFFSSALSIWKSHNFQRLKYRKKPYLVLWRNPGDVDQKLGDH